MCTAGVAADDGGATGGATTGGADTADNGGAVAAPSSTALNPPQVNTYSIYPSTRTNVVKIHMVFFRFSRLIRFVVLTRWFGIPQPRPSSWS